MASVDMAVALNYRMLGASYVQRQGRLPQNAMYKYLVGDPSAAAALEIGQQMDAAVSSGQDPSSITVPQVATAGGGSVERFDTDECEFVYLLNTPKMAPLNARGSSANVAAQEGAEIRRTFMARMFDVSNFQIAQMGIQREYDRYAISAKGQNEIARQTEQNARRHAITKMAFLHFMFFHSTIYVGPDGMLTSSSTGARLSFDAGIPSSHRSQINPGSGNIITTSWADTSADILQMVEGLRAEAGNQFVESPEIAFVNEQDKYLFRNNTKLLAYYNGSTDRLDKDLAANVVEFAGVKFIFVTGSFLVGTTVTQWVPRGKIAFMPPLGRWFLNAVGIEYVPAEAVQAADWSSLLGSLRPVYGDFAYAALTNNPVGMNVFMGSNFWHGFREPEAAWVPTVVF